MSGRRRRRGTRAVLSAVGLVAALGVAACGHTAPGDGRPAQLVSAPLTSAFATSSGTWALVLMGGAAAQHNAFWELFGQPSPSAAWQLATPPGAADNGGLVVAGSHGDALLAGVRPSQLLSFTPLVSSTDGGRHWTARPPLDASLADGPDALATAPSGQVLALLSNGQARLYPAGTRWRTVASRRSLGDSPAGRRCGLRGLTAVSFSPAGVPLLGGACAHGVGVFAFTDGTWRPTGPRLTGFPAAGGTTVLRLTRTGSGISALIAAGSGRGSSLSAAWSADNGSHWVLSPPLRLGGARLTSTGFGATGGVSAVLGGSRAETVAGPGSQWRPLPTLPPGAAAVTTASDGGDDALAVHRSVLTVWRLAPGQTSWRRAQETTVPIQYGSSG